MTVISGTDDGLKKRAYKAGYIVMYCNYVYLLLTMYSLNKGSDTK